MKDELRKRISINWEDELLDYGILYAVKFSKDTRLSLLHKILFNELDSQDDELKNILEQII
jgi:hypothetical protein